MGSSETLDNVLLVLLIPQLRPLPLHIAPCISQAASRSCKRLLVLLASPVFDFDGDSIRPTDIWDDAQKLLALVYGAATAAAVRDDNPLLEVDVIFRGLKGCRKAELGKEWNVVLTSKSEDKELIPETLSSISRERLDAQVVSSSEPDGKPLEQEPSIYPPRYTVTAMGGTFDHLHAGHKILLTMAALITSERLIVGVTSEKLLKTKKHADLLESLQTRILRTREFLALAFPQLKTDVVAIEDVYGPTAYDPDVRALVVSRETLSGAEAIAKLRSEKELHLLTTFIIEVLGPDASTMSPTTSSDKLKSAKMSSTAIRAHLADLRLKDTRAQANIAFGVPEERAASSPETMIGRMKSPGKTEDAGKLRKSPYQKVAHWFTRKTNVRP